MPDQVIIEGDAVRLVRTQVIHETLLNNLVPHLFTREPVTLPLLPRNPVRFLSFNPDAQNGLAVLETKPRRTTMQVRHSGDTRQTRDASRAEHDGIARFNVALPFQYFAYNLRITPRRDGTLENFTIVDSYLFWSPTAITSPNDRLWIAQCPNVNGSGGICWGSTRSDPTSLANRLDDLTNNFWTTVFNEDLGHRTPFGTSMTEWEEHSDGLSPHLNWPMFRTPGPFAWSELPDRVGHHPRSVADLDPSFVELPELPEAFSLARAHEWLNSLPENTLRRLTLALDTRRAEAEPIEVEA